uniref:Uncharacterized protein n=1 Tax=Oncorhynchus tshawytscha TaxID=74940 RepID=A0AAZ3SHX6_ONCTS
MLCESRLWSMTYCSDQDRLDPLPPIIEPPRMSVKAGSEPAAATLLQASPGQPSRNGHSILSRVLQSQRPSQASAQIQPQALSPPQDLHSQKPHPDRHISPEMEIPGQACSGGEVPFLVPSFCQSICQNYSDLHMGVTRCCLSYMLENMARDGGCGEGLPCPLLASELILTSLDQITLQLSREGHLEAGRAKDMVLSCLLRVASGLQSSEINTPLLQISMDLQLPTDTATGAAASGATCKINKHVDHTNVSNTDMLPVQHILPNRLS